MKTGIPITAPGYVSSMRTARLVDNRGGIVGPSDYGRIVGPSDRTRFGQIAWSDAADKAITVFTVGVVAAYVFALGYMYYDGRRYRRRR